MYTVKNKRGASGVGRKGEGKKLKTNSNRVFIIKKDIFYKHSIKPGDIQILPSLILTVSREILLNYTTFPFTKNIQLLISLLHFFSIKKL